MHFIFNSKPEAKARPRQGKNGFYDPKSAVQTVYEWEVRQQMGDKNVLRPLECAIGVDFDIRVPMPKKWSKSQKKLFLGQPAINKPDIDNYIKFYMDVLSGLFYQDDKLVTHGTFRKTYDYEGKVTVRVLPHDEYIQTSRESILFFRETLEDICDIAKAIMKEKDTKKTSELAFTILQKVPYGWWDDEN